MKVSLGVKSLLKSCLNSLEYSIFRVLDKVNIG